MSDSLEARLRVTASGTEMKDGGEIRWHRLVLEGSCNGREVWLCEPSWRSQGHGHQGRALPHWSSFWRIFFTQGILGSAQISRSLTVRKLEGGGNKGVLARSKDATSLLWKLSIYESLTVCKDAHHTDWLSIYGAPAPCRSTCYVWFNIYQALAACKHTSAGGVGEKKLGLPGLSVPQPQA